MMAKQTKTNYQTKSYSDRIGSAAADLILTPDSRPMKKLLSILLVLAVFIPSFGQDVLPKPNPPRLVIDAANVLTPEQREILEQKLVALDDSTSNQIAVVLIKTLGDYGIEEYALKLFREWGIGNKKTNNGVLLIAAIDDRKVRIEVGYGLEGAIPDIVSASIIRNEISPGFREGNYYRGIDNAINALTKAAVGEYKVKKANKKSKVYGEKGGSIVGFILIIIVVIILSIIKGGRGGRGPRGGMMSRNGFGDIATGMLLGSLLGGGGRGGGGWGGSSGGGGFGGFGGGSSGGGGASGGW
jgi:uncharacterized protein